MVIPSSRARAAARPHGRSVPRASRSTGVAGLGPPWGARLYVWSVGAADSWRRLPRV